MYLQVGARKVYISEITRRLETYLKKHKGVCIKGFTDKSAIAEHEHLVKMSDKLLSTKVVEKEKLSSFHVHRRN